jgi:hypothetical protein
MQTTGMALLAVKDAAHGPDLPSFGEQDVWLLSLGDTPV